MDQRPPEPGTAREPTKGPLLSAVHEVIKELRCWIEPSDEQKVSGPGAGDIEQVALGVVYVGEVGVVCDGGDPRLQRDHLVIAGGDDDCTELEALGPVHRRDRHGVGRDVGVVVELANGKAEEIDSGPGTWEFGG